MNDHAKLYDRWKANQEHGHQSGLILLQILMVVLPIPLATNRIWSLAIIVPLALLTLAMSVRQNLQNKLPVLSRLGEFKGLLVPQLAFCAWVILSVIPLPHGVISALSPEAAAWATLANQGTPPAWATLSVVPSQTYIYLLVCLILLCVTLSTVLTCRKWDHLKRLAVTITFSGVAQAILGVILFGMHAKYTIFDDELVHDVAQGSFGNRNHFASYLVLSLSLGIGLLLGEGKSEEKPPTRWQDKVAKWLRLLMSTKAPLRILLITMVVGLVLSRSRMGNTSFIIALFGVIGSFMILTSKRRSSVLLFLISMIVVDLVIVGSWIGIDRVVERVQNTDVTQEQKAGAVNPLERQESLEERWVAAKATTWIIANYPIFGSGGGTFVNTYPVYGAPVEDGYHMPAAHCDYVEIPADTGWVGLILLAVMYVLGMWQALRRMLDQNNRSKRRAMAAGILMALVAAALHALVEFIFQIPANAATICCILAMSWCLSHPDVTSGKQSRRRRNRRNSGVTDSDLNTEIGPDTATKAA